MRSFLEGVGVADDPVARRAGGSRRWAGSAARAAASRSRSRPSILAAAPAARSRSSISRCSISAAAGAAASRRHGLGQRHGTRSAARTGCPGSRPRGGWRARITRGYAVIFRRGWRGGRPRSSAGGGAAGDAGGRLPVVDLGGDAGGSLSVPLPVLDLGGGGFCGGRGGRACGGTDSVSGTDSVGGTDWVPGVARARIVAERG